MVVEKYEAPGHLIISRLFWGPIDEPPYYAALAFRPLFRPPKLLYSYDWHRRFEPHNEHENLIWAQN